VCARQAQITCWGEPGQGTRVPGRAEGSTGQHGRRRVQARPWRSRSAARRVLRKCGHRHLRPLLGQDAALPHAAHAAAARGRGGRDRPPLRGAGCGPRPAPLPPAAPRRTGSRAAQAAPCKLVDATHARTRSGVARRAGGLSTCPCTALLAHTAQAHAASRGAGLPCNPTLPPARSAAQRGHAAPAEAAAPRDRAAARRGQAARQRRGGRQRAGARARRDEVPRRGPRGAAAGRLRRRARGARGLAACGPGHGPGSRLLCMAPARRPHQARTCRACRRCLRPRPARLRVRPRPPPALRQESHARKLASCGSVRPCAASSMLMPAWPGAARAAPPLTVQLVRELATALLVVECTCALRPAPRKRQEATLVAFVPARRRWESRVAVSASQAACTASTPQAEC